MLVKDTGIENAPVLDFEKFGPFTSFLLSKRGLRSFQPTLLWQVRFTSQRKGLDEIIFTDSITVPGETISTNALDLSPHTINYPISTGRSTSNTTTVGFYVDVYNTVERIIYPWMKEISIFGVKDNTIQIDLYGFRMGTSKTNPDTLVIESYVNSGSSETANSGPISEPKTRPCYLHYKFLGCFPTTVPEYTYDQQNQKWANVRQITFGFSDYDIELLSMDSEGLYTGNESFKHELDYEISDGPGQPAVNIPHVSQYNTQNEKDRVPSKTKEAMTSWKSKLGAFANFQDILDTEKPTVMSLFGPRMNDAWPAQVKYSGNGRDQGKTNSSAIENLATYKKFNKEYVPDTEDRFGEDPTKSHVAPDKFKTRGEVRNPGDKTEPMAPDWGKDISSGQSGLPNTDTFYDTHRPSKKDIPEHTPYGNDWLGPGGSDEENPHRPIKPTKWEEFENNEKDTPHLNGEVTKDPPIGNDNMPLKETYYYRRTDENAKDRTWITDPNGPIVLGIEEQKEIKETQKDSIIDPNYTDVELRNADTPYLNGAPSKYPPIGEGNRTVIEGYNYLLTDQNTYDRPELNGSNPTNDMTGKPHEFDGEQRFLVGKVKLEPGQFDDSDTAKKKNESWVDNDIEMINSAGILVGKKKLIPEEDYPKKDEFGTRSGQTWTIEIGQGNTTLVPMGDKSSDVAQKNESWVESGEEMVNSAGVSVGKIVEPDSLDRLRMHRKTTIVKPDEDDDTTAQKNEEWTSKNVSDYVGTSGIKFGTYYPGPYPMNPNADTPETMTGGRPGDSHTADSVGNNDFRIMVDVPEDDFTEQFKKKESNLKNLIKTLVKGYITPDTPVYHGLRAPVSKAIRKVQQWFYTEPKHKDTPVDDHTEIGTHNNGNTVSVDPEDYTKLTTHRSNDIEVDPNDYTKISTHRSNDIEVPEDDYTKIESHKSNDVEVPEDDYTSIDNHNTGENVDVDPNDTATHDTEDNFFVIDPNDYVVNHATPNLVNPDQGDDKMTYGNPITNEIDSDDVVDSINLDANTVAVDPNDVPGSRVNANTIEIDPNDVVTGSVDSINVEIDQEDFAVGERIQANDVIPNPNDFVQANKIKAKVNTIDQNDVRTDGKVSAKELTIDPNDFVVANKLTVNAKTPDANDYVDKYATVKNILPSEDTPNAVTLKANTVNIDANDIPSKNISVLEKTADANDVVETKTIKPPTVIPQEKDTPEGTKVSSPKTVLPDSADDKIQHDTVKTINADPKDTPDATKIQTSIILSGEDTVDSKSIETSSVQPDKEDTVNANKVSINSVIPDKNDIIEHGIEKLKEIFAEEDDTPMKHDTNVKTVAIEKGSLTKHKNTIEIDVAKHDIVDVENIKPTIKTAEKSFIDFAKLIINERKDDLADSVTSHSETKEVNLSEQGRLTSHSKAKIVDRPIEPQSVGRNRDEGKYVNPHEPDHTRINTTNA